MIAFLYDYYITEWLYDEKNNPNTKHNADLAVSYFKWCDHFYQFKEFGRFFEGNSVNEY